MCFYFPPPNPLILILELQSKFPELLETIVMHLKKLGGSGVQLSVPVVQGIMLGHIKHGAPQVLEARAKDGSKFRCTDAFVWKFLWEQMRYIP
jgi:hypothetical protein